MMDIKLQDVNGFGKLLKNFPSVSKRIMKREFFEIATEYRNNVIRKMQSTPRLTSTKKAKKRGKKLHFPSRPNNAPAIDSGDLIKGMMVRPVSNGAAFIIRGVPYAPILETGAPRNNMKARPVYMRTLRQMKAGIKQDLLKAVADSARRST